MNRSQRKWWRKPHISKGSFPSKKNHRSKLWAGNELVTWRIAWTKRPNGKGKERGIGRYHNVGSVHRLCILLWEIWEAVWSFKWKSAAMYLFMCKGSFQLLILRLELGVGEGYLKGNHLGRYRKIHVLLFCLALRVWRKSKILDYSEGRTNRHCS